MTREILLNSAIKDYKDTKQSVIATPYKRFIDKNGYCFIIKQANKAFNLDCAVHIDVNWEINEFLGNIRSVNVDLITRTRLTADVLIEYEDLIIFLKSYDAYNETMGQFDYKGTAIKATDFILLEKPSQLYGTSVFEKLLDFDKYKIVPKYLSANDWTSDIILADIESNDTLSLATPLLDVNTITQMKSDKVTFYLTNFSREKILNFQKDLIEYSINYHNLGFLSNPIVKDEKVIDENAVVQTILTSIEVNLSYNIEVDLKSYDNKLISAVCYRLKNFAIELNDKYIKDAEYEAKPV